MSTQESAKPTVRKVGIGLALGIVILPIVFVWFLLRQGHSVRARVLGFGWLVFFIVLGQLGSHLPPAPQRASVAADTPASAAGDNAAATDTAAATEAHARDNPQEAMTVEVVRWSKGGFGVVLTGNFKVTNQNDFDVKDVEISCDLVGASGTHLSSPSNTVYQIVKAKSSAVFRDVNLGFINYQAAHGTCSVTGAVAL